MTMDRKGWVTVGIFALAVFELLLRALVPDLRADEVFKEVTLGTFTSGVFMIASFDFGSSAGSAKKDDVIAEAVAKQPDQSR